MLSLLGWVILVLFGIGLVLSWLAIVFECGGQYNIGGVPNTWKDKLLIIITLVLLIAYWRWVGSIAPLTISLNYNFTG